MKPWEPPEKACNPYRIPSLDGEGKIVQLNGEEGAHLAEIFDGPTCGCGSELTIARVDLCSLMNQEFSDRAVSAKCRVMQYGGSAFVSLVQELRMFMDDLSDLVLISALRCFQQIVKDSHSSSAIARAWYCDAMGYARPALNFSQSSMLCAA